MPGISDEDSISSEISSSSTPIPIVSGFHSWMEGLEETPTNGSIASSPETRQSSEPSSDTPAYPSPTPPPARMSPPRGPYPRVSYRPSLPSSSDLSDTQGASDSVSPQIRPTSLQVNTFSAFIRKCESTGSCTSKDNSSSHSGNMSNTERLQLARGITRPAPSSRPSMTSRRRSLPLPQMPFVDSTII